VEQLTADVVIVGGGPAGLTAALILARAGRAVTVVDAGQGRNAPASHAHNVFTRDGTPPSELRRIGRAQAEGYGARFIDTNATDAVASGDHVELQLADGGRVTAKRMILATGVIDVLPDISGIRQAWGRTAVNCPYCHGHELRDRPTVVLGKGESGFDLARLLLGWTRNITLISDGSAELSKEQRDILSARGIATREDRVQSIEVDGTDVRAVLFASGELLPCGAVYLRPPQQLRGPLPEALRLEMTEHQLIRTDDMGRTSVPSVFACGDAVTPKQMVQLAAATGVQVGAVVNHELIAQGLVG
jgi:thioredoxin reductase